MDQFKSESTSIKQLLRFNQSFYLVVIYRLSVPILLLTLFCIFLTACNQISLQKKTSHNLIRTPVEISHQIALTHNQKNVPINLSGMWKIGFRYHGKTELGSMELQQNNQKFSGHGKDENGATFQIEQGQIKGSEIIFLKRYDNHPNQSVQYHGQFSYLNTENGELPYMGGDFSLELNGVLSVGEWEASVAEIKTKPEALTVPTKTNEPEIAAEQTRYPDLSGKWSVAYEYNFKTIHSTMFLEQDGNKITGHGIDTNTKEKFVIKKGWYTFPHLTIIRQYPNRAPANSLITFRAEVSEVQDKDYTGPYLSGQTQGGGDWEAERVN